MTNKTFYIDAPFGKIPAILYTPTVQKSDVVVVFYHGRDEKGDGTIAGLQRVLGNGNHKNLLDKAEQYGFRVLAPQYVQQLGGWSPGWTRAYVEPIIDYALQNLTKLPKVGVTGLSQGGGGTWLTLTNPKTAPKVFAAIPICPTGEYADENDFSLIAKNSIAVWDFHAKDDGTVSVVHSRNMVAKANSFDPNPKVKYDELGSGQHFIWGTVYAKDEIYPWLLSYAPTTTAPLPQPLPEPVDEVLATYKTIVYKSGKITNEKI